MSQTTFFGAHFSIILGLILLFIGVWMILKNSQSTAWGWFWVIIGGIYLALGFIEMGLHAKMKEIEESTPDMTQFAQQLAATQAKYMTVPPAMPVVTI